MYIYTNLHLNLGVLASMAVSAEACHNGHMLHIMHVSSNGLWLMRV